MKREKLLEIKRAAKKVDFHPTVALVHSLVESHLQLLDASEGGPEIQEMRADLAERSRQLKLALTDVHSQAAQANQYASADSNVPEPLQLMLVARATNKTKYLAELALEMVKAKGPQWKREWSWYTPRLDEEFGGDLEWWDHVASRSR